MTGEPFPERARQLAWLFLRLGATAFGGPAAHIAMMHREVVDRRGWLEEQHFVDMIGATSLIPGPNSTEMAMHVGFRRAGWRGLLLAGAAFILPAALIVLAFAWAYVRYGGTPAGAAVLYGVKPVVIAIVLHALARLGRRAVDSWELGLVALVAAGLYLVGANELVLLAAGAVAVLLRHAAAGALRLAVPVPLPVWPGRTGGAGLGARLPPLVLDAGAFGNGVGLIAVAAPPLGLLRLFALFLKIGAVLYGSGYVLLAFLHGDFVQRLGLLTDRQLIDAVAVGQLTPGPVFTTATFIGYLLRGLPGAIVATVGIFLPSFVFVGFLGWLLPRIREREWAGWMLDGVNAAALGLMGGVLLQLGFDALRDPFTVLLAIAAALLLWRTDLSSIWLILGGAAAGGIAAAIQRGV